MNRLAQLWRKFLAPFETMQHHNYDSPWEVRVRRVSLPTPRR